MGYPYKIYSQTTGVGPYSYSGIEFMGDTPIGNQINVYKNDTKLTQGSGPLQADYWVQENSQSITLATALIGSDTLEIRRETPDLSRITTFTDGAKLTASSLNRTLDQLFFLIQEKSFYSTTVEEFPNTLIDLTGVSNRDTLTWEASQGKFVAGIPNISASELNDVSYATSPVSGDFLKWGGSYWAPASVTEFSAADNHTFTGNCTFNNPVTVPPATGNNHAVNRSQLDAIIQDHADDYTMGLRQRILDLEGKVRNVIGRGRYWNTVGNYYPKLETSSTHTTFPVFDSTAARADYENFHNLILAKAGYVPQKCDLFADPITILGGNNSGAGVNLVNWTAWDVFYWDFEFESSLIVDDASRSNVGIVSDTALPSNQYQVVITMDGTDDGFESQSRGAGAPAQEFLEINGSGNFVYNSMAGFNPTYLAPKSKYPFFADLNIYAGGHDKGLAWYDSNGGAYAANRLSQRWGEQHAFQKYDDGNDYESGSPQGYIWSEFSGRANITEPMTLGPAVYRKTNLGFTVMYAIKRPVVFVFDDSMPAYTRVKLSLWNHGSSQGNNNPSSGGASHYSGLPLLKDFNLNISVLQ